MVYHLYELSYDEALVIDATLSLEDFEKNKYKINYEPIAIINISDPKWRNQI